MKKIVFFLAMTLLAQCVIAQPTQAEIEKRMKEVQKEIDAARNDPKYKNAMNGISTPDSTLKKKPTEATGDFSKNPFKTTASYQFPQKNITLLNSIPKKILSRQELISFLTALYAELKKALPAIKVQAAQAIITKFNNDAAKISLVGSLAWYKNAPAEAVLLLTYAASQSPDDNTLNNCGAVLNLCGLENKAIPILKYALAHQPESSTLLNNIGQAYAGLGEIDTASYYLIGCIRRSTNHPQACGTEAYIEEKKGNTSKAAELAEQAIKGGYSSTIVEFYKKIKKDWDLLPLLENNIDPDDHYFEMADWKFPPLCRSWQECENIYPKQQAFLKKIEGINKRLQLLAKGEPIPDLQNTKEMLIWSLSQNINPDPLAKVAQALTDGFVDFYSDDTKEAYTEWHNKLIKSDLDQGNEEIAFHEKWAPILNGASGERLKQLLVQQCQERKNFLDRYLADRADFTIQYRDKRWEKDITFYNTMVFLLQFTTPNEKTFRAQCAGYASMVLNYFSIYAGAVGNTCNPAQKPNCGDYDPEKQDNSGDPKFTEANCPVNLEIPFGVGKMSLNCTRYELEMGEGIILNFEKNFVSRESTVAIGLGVGAFIPGIPGAESSPLEATVKEQLYIKFDKDNQPSDIGMLWETELDVKGLADPGIKVGYTLGINSGYNFNKGALEGKLKNY